MEIPSDEAATSNLPAATDRTDQLQQPNKRPTGMLGRDVRDGRYCGGVTQPSPKTSVTVSLYNIQLNQAKVGFQDIFAEPDGLGSGDIGRFLSPAIRRIFGLVFIYSQEAVYYFLAVTSGIFLSLAWGAVFGVTSFFTVWILQPLLQFFLIALRITFLPFRAVVRSLIDPFFQSIGQTFSSMSANIHWKVQKDYRPGLDRNVCVFPDRQNYSSQEWFGFV